MNPAITYHSPFIVEAFLLAVSVDQCGFDLGSSRAVRARRVHMKSTYHYRERDYTFGNLCVTLRTAIGVTQGELARLLGVTERAIQTWEGGTSYPKVDSLKRFIEVCVQRRVFAVGHEEEEIRALWQAARQRVLLDELWLHKLLYLLHPE